MKISLTITLLATSAAGMRMSTDTHVVHEKLSDADLRVNWVKGPLDSAVQVPLRISLKQSNLDQAEKWLMEVSDPQSTKYGQYWTEDDVIEAFKPTQEAVDMVTKWLVDSGIDESRIAHSRNKQWLAVQLRIDEGNQLLNTAHYNYTHTNGESIIACDEYSIPEHLQQHVDYVTPGLKGSLISRSQKLETSHSLNRGAEIESSWTSWDNSDLTTCDQTMTPACIAALYEIPPQDPHATVSSNNTFGLYERGDYYAQADLDAFFANFTPWIEQSTHPVLFSIDGGMAPVAQSDAGAESDLDLDVIFPIIYPQKISLFQTDDRWYAYGGDPLAGGHFNTFLDALDGSYCTYSAYGETGDSPVLDPTYPDGHDYNGTLMCGTYKPTNVISVSYGLKESIFPEAYQKRQCNEFLKLGLRGTSIFFAAGDTGVQGGDGTSAHDGCLRNGTVFQPTYPNSCPWLTNVGATAINPGRTIFEPESAAFDPISPSNPHVPFYSSGGFSNIYPIPQYQAAAVEEYFSNHNPPYPYYYNGDYMNSTGLYNRNGRGIPDVAANGFNIATVVQGHFRRIWGTSASAPLFASIINRIVEERIKIGKGPVGFINPALYKNPWLLTDIVNGTNPGCNTDGFSCVEGWDPVSGLGTPSYPKLLDFFLSLP